MSSIRALKPSTAKTSKSRGLNPRVGKSILPPIAAGLVARHIGFPVLPVEMIHLETACIHAFEASDIDVDFVGVGARNIKRGNAAARTEVMLRGASIEGVGCEILARGQQAETIARHDPVQIALLRAD